MKVMSQNNRNLLALQIYIFTAILGCITALLLVFQNPSELDNALIFGLSKIRLVVALGLLFGGALLVLVLGKMQLNKEWGAKFGQRIRSFLKNNFVYASVLFASLIVLFLTSQLWRLSQTAQDPYVQGYLGRLAPLLILMGWLSFQNLLFAPLIRLERLANIIPKKLVVISAITFAVMLILWGWIALTGIGIKPDLMGWDAPGVPVLVTQIWLVWGFGFIFLGIEILNIDRKPKIFDILVSLVIWGLACYLWGGQPLSADYFALEPIAPNFEFYPYSDAATHDVMAQGLLIGNGYPGIARKPLYAAFLALMHVVTGQSYADVVMLQVMVIALIPLCLYWLAKSLHLRVSGVIVALLVILRERNAIALSGVIGVSHVKLLMSDLPATLGIVLLTLVIVVWLRKLDQHRIFPLIIGGLMGLLLLVRPQISVFIPAILVLFVVLFFRRRKLGVLSIALFCLGLSFSLLPWLWRSHQITGQFVLNDPTQNAFLTQQYTLTLGQGRVKPLPGETAGEFSQRVDQYLSDFMLTNPGYVASFVTSHFSHNIVEMMITLPMSPWVVQNGESDLFPYWAQQGDRLWNSCCSVQAYVKAQPFWDQWLGDVGTEAIFSLIINLAILAIGLAIALVNKGIVGFMPLGVGLVYVVSTSLGRYSGWRLILPADWVLFLYFSIGLGQLSHWLLRFYTGQNSIDQKELQPENIWQQIAGLSAGQLRDYRSGIVLSIVFLSLGLSPLLIERFVPQRYEMVTRQDVQVYFDDVSGLEQFLEEEHVILLRGKALYPRFYKSDQGEPGGDWPALSPRDYSRLGFVLVGPHDAHVVLPSIDAPDFFPHASDAIVFGCPEDEYVRAKLVVLMREDGYTLVPSSDGELSCDSP